MLAVGCCTPNINGTAAPTLLSVVPSAGSTAACPNAVVTALFSEPMNPATINAADFTVAPGVIGTVTHDTTNTLFTLTPSSNLAAGAVYTITITSAARDVYGNALAANYVSSFTTAANSCKPPPTVVSVTPPNLSVNNCPNKVLTATFSEPMDPTTINTSDFSLVSSSGTVIAGTVAYTPGSTVAVFQPHGALALNTTYTATIYTSNKDLYGNNLANNYVWTFSTGANTCAPAPPPSSNTPANGSTGICPNVPVSVTYTQAMNPATINTNSFLLNVTGGAAVAGVVTAGPFSKVYTFTPNAPLALSTNYTATITTAAADAFGNTMAQPFTFSFNTGTSSCTSVTPTVISVTPVANAQGVCLNSVATATFSTAMNPTTLNTNTFTLAPNTVGTVTIDGTNKIATFTPTANLTAGTTYTATITTGAQSSGGTPLAANYLWSFTTNSQACQPPVNLNSAANYGVMAAATVTNTGPTTITGENLALFPGTSVTGFPPGMVVPPNYEDITTPTAAQAELDATIAYNYMAGLPNAAVLPAELSGLTITPGLYKNASSVGLTSGNLTLDAQGNSNAVFIFQIGSSFTTLGSTQVILTGGAQAKNVFWQVGSSATLGTYSTFKGTIIAFSSNTLKTGVNLVGRALALNAAVTLDTDTIVAP